MAVGSLLCCAVSTCTLKEPRISCVDYFSGQRSPDTIIHSTFVETVLTNYLIASINDEAAERTYVILSIEIVNEYLGSRGRYLYLHARSRESNAK